MQDYCESNEPISLKLDVMIGSTNWKKWLIFVGDPVPDIDSRLLLHFPHHCVIGDFRFVSISHNYIQSPADFHDTRR